MKIERRVYLVAKEIAYFPSISIISVKWPIVKKKKITKHKKIELECWFSKQVTPLFTYFLTCDFVPIKLLDCNKSGRRIETSSDSHEWVCLSALLLNLSINDSNLSRNFAGL